jgi:hypothetical protein
MLIISAILPKTIKNIKYVLYLLNKNIVFFEKIVINIGFTLCFLLFYYRIWPIFIYR